jgi:hypothetical protein
MILLTCFRQGIGFDIEYNEDICHVLETSEGDNMYSFAGVIIMLPFFKLYIGELVEIGTVIESSDD